MTIFATSGAKFYIGPEINASEPLDESSFTGATWVEIKPMEGLGSLGDEASAIEFGALGRERMIKVKGLRNAPNMEVVAGIDYADAGQIALLAAEKTDKNYGFRVVFDDAPTGGTPSERKFAAIVGSAIEAYDTADSVMKLNASLWVNSNIVRTNAAEAA